MAKRVAIIYGWAEGPWQSKKFIKELKGAGFAIEENPIEADVLFAHSAGCYLIPPTIKARLLVLDGLPYWPGRSMASGVVHKLISELRYLRRNRGLTWWLNKIAHNGWYIISRPQKTYYLLTRHQVEKLPKQY